MGFYDVYHGVNEMVKKLCIELVRMSDEHMAEVREANGGVDSMTDEELLEHGIVRLPKDADGVTIRVGDVMEWCDSGETLTVEGIGRDVLFYIDGENAEWTAARNKRHHHAPTVEDVLREFADEMNQNLGMYTGEAIDADEWRDADAKTVEKFAAKLRLADDGRRSNKGLTLEGCHLDAAVIDRMRELGIEVDA